MHLLDINALIALAWDDHEHHEAAHAWFAANAGAGFVTCHVTQSGFLRLSLNPKVVGCSISTREAILKLESFTLHPNRRFWNDGPVETRHEIWSSVTGHLQVTDTNLCLIARHNQGKLATFDRSIRNRVHRAEQPRIEVISA